MKILSACGREIVSFIQLLSPLTKDNRDVRYLNIINEIFIYERATMSYPSINRKIKMWIHIHVYVDMNLLFNEQQEIYTLFKTTDAIALLELFAPISQSTSVFPLPSVTNFFI